MTNSHFLIVWGIIMNMKQIGLVGLLSSALCGYSFSGESEKSMTTTNAVKKEIIIQKEGYTILHRIDENYYTETKSFSYSHLTKVACATHYHMSNGIVDEPSHVGTLHATSFESYRDNNDDGLVDSGIRWNNFGSDHLEVYSKKEKKSANLPTERTFTTPVLNEHDLFQQLKEELSVSSVHKQWLEKYGTKGDKK